MDKKYIAHERRACKMWMMLGLAKIHNNPPLTFKPKALQRFASGRGVIGNITIHTIMREYVRRKRMKHLLSVCCNQR